MTDKKQREEIEQKRLRILEADEAKKARIKDLMDKAMAAMAEGKYVEAEAYAKRAHGDRPQRGHRPDPGLQGPHGAPLQGRGPEPRRQGGRRRPDPPGRRHAPPSPPTPSFSQRAIKYAHELQGPDPRPPAS